MTVQELFDDAVLWVDIKDTDDLNSICYAIIEEKYSLIDTDLVSDCYFNVWPLREGPNIVGIDYTIETTQEIEEEFKNKYPEEVL